ncbi:MAG TPA: histidine kinase [Gaiellaceae bacterium]|nr:histidine kinase [Gaiellaceae bacterium]
MTTVAPAYRAEPDAVRAPGVTIRAAIALAGLAAASYSFVSALQSPAVGAELGEPLVVALLANWITVSYVLCGLLAWAQRPDSRFGPLMVAAGFANFVSTLSWTTNDATFTLGQALDLVPPVLFLHVFLAFPTGRLRSRFERRLVAGAYAAAVVGQVVRMAFGGFGPDNLLELWPNEEAGLVSLRVALLTMSAACLAGVGVLAWRRRRSGPPLRRSLTLLVDAFALGLVMIAALFVSAAFDGPAVQEIRWATFAALGIAPVAFLALLLNARLARTSVGDFFVALREEPAPADLREALAQALRDPSLELAYWLPEFGSYAGPDGRPVELPRDDPRRATTSIERDGARVAVLVHDPSLLEEPELLDAVTAAAAIALENAQLHVELRARLEEVRASRARVIDAAQKERQRLERNLHDGAQQRLVALALNLRLLEQRVDDAGTREQLDDAQKEIERSLAELRDLAHGIHPAVVTGHGLGVALEQVTARAPLPVGLTVDVGGRLPEPVEVAAYYVVTESLANVAKHARAGSATVSVGRRDGWLEVEVVDDGCGGADSERGSGIRGLADRVEALGGRLRVWTPRGGGTRVRAEIPCA